jgi:hypothetical protein
VTLTETGVPSPGSTRFCAALGHNGTSAILSFDHDLLEFSSYINGVSSFVRSYPQDNSLGSLLAQAQKNERDTKQQGWGLSLQENILPSVERGFVGYRWPTQRRRYRRGDLTFGMKATTYVEDGRLIQAMAIASGMEHTLKWRLGGKIQFINKDLIPFGSVYSKSHTQQGEDLPIHVLSVKHNDICMDVQLFLNEESQDLQRCQDQYATCNEEFADFTCSGSHDLLGDDQSGILIAVLVFTLRDSTKQPKPDYSRGPAWEDIEKHLCLDEASRNSSEALELLREGEKVQLLQAPQLSHIILRNVEQLLSIAALPNSVGLLNSFARRDRPETDYEATL